MPTALFLGLPLHGHTNPTLPLVEELVSRGHEVVYYATEPFAGAIRRAGASYRPYRNRHLNDTAGIPARLDELAYLLTRTAAEILEQELDGMRDVGADYVITDATAPWGHWVAEALGVPVLTSVTTFAFNRQVLGYGVRRGARPKSAAFFWSKVRNVLKAIRLQRTMRRRHHLQGPGAMASMFGRSDLNIVYTSRAFQPCVETFDKRFVFIGPSVARKEAGTIDWPGHPGPILYVSLGTLFHDNAAFYRACFDAFVGEPYGVIMSIGSAVSMESLGAPPANVSVHVRVPQLQVLERSAAFVTHGGMNSVSEGLWYGVPLVVIPQMSEQLIVGRRVEDLGAGLCLTNEQATADALRGAVRQVLGEERYRRAAVTIGDSFRAAGGVSLAVDRIEAFVTGAHRRASP